MAHTDGRDRAYGDHGHRQADAVALELEGDRIAGLREYWTSERVSS